MGVKIEICGFMRSLIWEESDQNMPVFAHSDCFLSCEVLNNVTDTTIEEKKKSHCYKWFVLKGHEYPCYYLLSHC